MRLRLALVLAALATLGAAPKAKEPAAPRHPNVLLFLVDDLGWGEVGYQGGEQPTPQIDRLAAQGVVLERFYGWPICSPSRAALLTGRTPLALGLRANFHRGESGLTLDARLLPEFFRAVGYQTALLGKWHLGFADPYLPQHRGFDHFYGLVGAAVNGLTHRIGPDKALDWQRDGVPVEEEGYTTDLLADEALRLLAGRDKSRPLLLVLSFRAVHGPFAAPEALVRKHAALGREQAVYAAMLESVDTAIGRVLAAVDAAGLRDDTLVVFLSDNGTARGAPIRASHGAKGDIYEGGIRIPAAIRWPGVLPAGRRSRQLGSLADVLPTLADAAQVPLPPELPLDGIDLWPALREGREQPRELVIGLEEFAVIQGRWKLIQLVEGPPQLFDLEADPGEQHDVSAEHPELTASLAARLARELSHAPPEARRLHSPVPKRPHPGGRW